MTRKAKIIQYLKRRPKGATNRDLILNGGGNWPHKRVDELERDGYTFDRYQDWHQPAGERGAWVTRYVLAGEPGQ